MPKCSKTTFHRRVNSAVKDSLTLVRSGNHPSSLSASDFNGSPPSQALHSALCDPTQLDRPSSSYRQPATSSLAQSEATGVRGPDEELFTSSGESVEEENPVVARLLARVLERDPHCEASGAAFIDQLRSWAIESGVSHVALDKLLKLLQAHPCFSDIPVCARTVLKTPRVADAVQAMGAGKYCHFGLAAGLQHSLAHLHETPDHILININVDGLPLYCQQVHIKD